MQTPTTCIPHPPFWASCASSVAICAAAGRAGVALPLTTSAYACGVGLDGPLDPPQGHALHETDVLLLRRARARHEPLVSHLLRRRLRKCERNPRDPGLNSQSSSSSRLARARHEENAISTPCPSPTPRLSARCTCPARRTTLSSARDLRTRPSSLRRTSSCPFGSPDAGSTRIWSAWPAPSTGRWCLSRPSSAS